MPKNTIYTSAPGTVLPRRAPRQSTRAPVTFQSIDTHDEQIEEEQDEDEENGGHDGDDNVLEILSMLKEFQKRKAAKASMRSAAFQNKKTAHITEARETADTVVRDGVAYLDSFKVRIAELRTQETWHQEHLKDLSMLWKNHDECMRNLLSTYSPFEDLSRRTTDHVNSASAMLGAHAAERHRSRRQLLQDAKARMGEDLELQKFATDATALIEHYKALLRS